jgi:hypothetical protein
MSVNVKPQKLLWGKAAGRCAYPNCRTVLAHEDDVTDPTLIGENCHIVGEKEDGPRGKSPLPLTDRNNYENLILMCRNHHKIIDDNENYWTVSQLHTIKNEHERWVYERLSIDTKRIEDDAYYGEIVDEWGRLCQLDAWDLWSNKVLGGARPRILEKLYDDLGFLCTRNIARIWPGRYPTLEIAFRNFQWILQDFLGVLSQHLLPMPMQGYLVTDKFYAMGGNFNPNYDRDVALFDEHVNLVSNLMLELTRAANLICDEVRAHILSSYRRKDGHLLVIWGDDFTSYRRVPSYLPEQITHQTLYRGAQSFQADHKDRDWYLGQNPR